MKPTADAAPRDVVLEILWKLAHAIPRVSGTTEQSSPHVAKSGLSKKAPNCLVSVAAVLLLAVDQRSLLIECFPEQIPVRLDWVPRAWT